MLPFVAAKVVGVGEENVDQAQQRRRRVLHSQQLLLGQQVHHVAVKGAHGLRRRQPAPPLAQKLPLAGGRIAGPVVPLPAAGRVAPGSLQMRNTALLLRQQLAPRGLKLEDGGEERGFLGQVGPKGGEGEGEMEIHGGSNSTHM